MEPRVSYTLVGLFVVILGAATVLGGLWLAAGVKQTDTRRYSVYITDSVSGLREDSPVTFHGVNVGKVVQLRIDRSNTQRIHAVIEARTDAPISRGTHATLKIRGLTGIAYIDLSGGGASKPPLRTLPGEAYPAIPYQPSLLMRLDTAVSEGLDRLDRLSGSVSALLSDDNIQAFSSTLGNLERITDGLAENRQQLTRVLDRAESMLDNGQNAMQRLPHTLDAVNSALSQVKHMADTVGQAGRDLSTMSHTGTEGLQRLDRSTLPRFEALTDQLRVVAGRLSSLADQLERNPEAVLRGAPRPAPGPGEGGE